MQTEDCRACDGCELCLPSRCGECGYVTPEADLRPNAFGGGDVCADCFVCLNAECFAADIADEHFDTYRF